MKTLDRPPPNYTPVVQDDDPAAEPADEVYDQELEQPEKDTGRFNAEDLLATARRDVRATLFRLRRQILPHAVTGTVLSAGFATQAITSHGSVSPTTALVVLASAGFPAAAGAAHAVKKRRPRWARRALWGGLVSAAWLSLSPYGVGPEHIAALVGAEFALAARWWQVNRYGYPEPADDTGPVEEETLTTAGQIIADWAEFVGSQSGPLAGSKLILPKETKHGFAFTLGLARGKQTLLTVLAALDKISTGLDVPVSDLVVDALPPDPRTGKIPPSRVRFQVLTESPVHGDVVFDGPRRRGGLLDLGPYADGQGEAQWRLYTPELESMWSGVIIGGTGIGKSRVAENIVISAMSGGDTVIWYLDPQGGASSPALAEHADWFGTMADAPAMLEAAIAILEARSDENALEGWTGFTPSAGRPGLLIVVEECHNAFTQQTSPRWGKLAREGRKVGLGIIGISQYPGLITFGGDEALRSSVMEGNALALRSTSNSTGQLMAGLDVNPKTLPKIPGYGYVQGSEETGIRTAPFRNRNTGKAAAAWLATQPKAQLETLAVTATLAAGTAYRDRNTSTDTGRTANAARVKALREGHLPDSMLRGTADQSETFAGSDLGNVVEFPGPLRLQDLMGPAHAPRLPKPLPALSGSRKAVYEAVAAGATQRIEVEKATGLSTRRVADLLKELVDAGYLVQPRFGRYQRAA